MTDYIVEHGKNRFSEFVDDGQDRVVLVTDKASVLGKPYRVPKAYKELIRMLSQLVPTQG
jgi:hypothetical protein